jgi:hypothetical protein
MHGISRILTRGGPIGVIAAALLLLPSASLAQTAANAKVQDDDAVTSAATTAVGPDGTLREPTHEERQELSRKVEQMMNRSARPAATSTVTTRGAVMAELDESYDSLTLARVADGKPQTRCVETPQEAKAFLDGRMASPSKKAAQPLEVE